MGKIEIPRESINEENINSALFLKYIEEYGFNPNNYYNILELFQPARGSMSQFLRQYKQYLLSRQVKYDELDEVGINGAYGYLDSTGIVVPKTLENDCRFFNPVKSLYKKHSYGTPSIYDFSVIIANEVVTPNLILHNDIGSPFYFPIDKYLGFCMNDTDENLAAALEGHKTLVNWINYQSSDKYTFEHDTLSSEGKHLCLIRKK